MIPPRLTEVQYRVLVVLVILGCMAAGLQLNSRSTLRVFFSVIHHPFLSQNAWPLKKESASNDGFSGPKKFMPHRNHGFSHEERWAPGVKHTSQSPAIDGTHPGITGCQLFTVMSNVGVLLAPKHGWLMDHRIPWMTFQPEHGSTWFN